MDMEKAKAELTILRDFVDFVNKQVGVYCDSLSGFEGNKIRIERQIPRVLHPAGREIKDGQQVMMWASVEDPSSPDVLHHRIIRADDFIAANSECGFNERQMCWSIIVFVFAYWDEEIRPRIAKVRRVATDDVRLDALGDLRIVRTKIVHNSGVLPRRDHARLKVMGPLFKPDALISPTHDEMHKLFIAIKQAIMQLILHYTGDLPGAPEADDIVSVAIQNPPRRK